VSDDLSDVGAAATVVTVVTVRVDTEGGMPARARRAVLPASSLLNSVVALAVAVVVVVVVVVVLLLPEQVRLF